MKPQITISSLDADRLYSLIDEISEKNMVGLDELEIELERANILPPEQMPDNVVTMNSRVKFVIADTQKEFELTLVFPKDVDNRGETISILAPVGSALLGLSLGDEIEWPKPGGGLLKVKITDIVYQPEREGQLYR